MELREQLRSSLRMFRGDMHKSEPVTGAPMQPETGLPEAIPTSEVTLQIGSKQTIGPLLYYKGANLYVVVVRDNEGNVTARAEWKAVGDNPNGGDDASDNVS
jgi:hypothetical protein